MPDSTAPGTPPGVGDLCASPSEAHQQLVGSGPALRGADCQAESHVADESSSRRARDGVGGRLRVGAGPLRASRPSGGVAAGCVQAHLRPGIWLRSGRFIRAGRAPARAVGLQTCLPCCGPASGELLGDSGSCPETTTVTRSRQERAGCLGRQHRSPRDVRCAASHARWRGLDSHLAAHRPRSGPAGMHVASPREVVDGNRG